MNQEHERFFEGLIISCMLSLIFCMLLFGAFTFGKYMARKELKCGQVECMQYRIEGELSCRKHQGRY